MSDEPEKATILFAGNNRVEDCDDAATMLDIPYSLVIKFNDGASMRQAMAAGLVRIAWPE